MTKTQAATVSIGSNAVLTLVKLVCGWLIGSMALLSEAIHSASDLLAALMAYVSVRISSRPEDETHPYGHGKFEDMAATFEAAMLLASSLWIIVESVRNLIHGTGPSSVGAGLGVMALSLVVNGAVSWFLFDKAREFDSVALEADALHLSTDALTSLGVIAGLGLVMTTGHAWWDSIAALLVALVIGGVGLKLGLKAIGNLVDASLPDDEVARIEKVLAGLTTASLSFHGLRTRKAGPDRHIDLHLAVPSDATMARAHELAHQVEAAIRNEVPGARILIHLEPVTPDAASVRIVMDAFQPTAPIDRTGGR